MTPPDDHNQRLGAADGPAQDPSGQPSPATGADDSSDSLDLGAAQAAAPPEGDHRPSDTRLPAHETTRPDKPSYRGEVVFLCVVLVLTMFFSLAGVPGEPEKVVSDASDALKKGWMEERLFEYYRGPHIPEAEVIRTEGEEAGEAPEAIEGTWLQQALQEQPADPFEGSQAQDDADLEPVPGNEPPADEPSVEEADEG